MEFILFLGVVILLWWVGSLSNRVTELEFRIKNLNGSAVPKDFSLVNNSNSKKLFSEESAKQQQVATAETITKPELIKQPVIDNAELATGWLNKIGVVALILGMVFFFKYAVDQGWIGPWLRITIGFLVSGLLVYLGHLWKEKYGSKAFALSGGGIALFYFTIFAGYQFYNLMPQFVAWVLMLLVAMCSVWLSNKYSSLVLGILGFIGAYGSPIMLNSGQDQQVSLFVFLTLLNTAILVISFKKFWVELLFLSLLGTVINYSVWVSSYSNINNTFVSLFFIIFTSALFGLTSSLLLRYHKENNSLPEHLENNLSVVYFFAGLFYLAGSWSLLANRHAEILPAIGLLGSVIFFFAYAVVDRLEYRKLNYFLSFVGATLLVYAAIWQYNGKSLAFALLIIALIGSVLGFLLKREELRVWALFILFMSLFKSLYEPYSKDAQVFLFNAKFGLMFANTLVMIFIGWLYGKFKPSEYEKNTEGMLGIVAAIVLWLGVSWDMSFGLLNLGRNVVDNYMTTWWVLYPVFICLAALFSKRAGLMKLGVIFAVAALFKVLVLPYGSETEFLLNAKFGLMFFETIVLIFVGYLYSRNQADDNSDASILYTIASVFFWITVSWEITKTFSGNTENLLLSLWWVMYAVVLMVVSAKLKSLSLRKVSVGMFILAILKVFLYDAQALDTPYRIIAFIVLGVILLSVSFSYNKNKEKIVNFLEGEK